MNSETNNVKGFNTFDIHESLQLAITKLGFERPTPIQAGSIPVALEGRDVLGCAGTGTGKTAAFAIPVIHDLLKNESKSAIVIAPTRELATQIAKVFESLLVTSKRSSLRVALLIGGESMERQIRVLRGHPRIIVGTPGRINDHLRRRRFQPRFFQTVVLDEADRMLDMGFEPQIREIITALPERRQTHMFSATFPSAIRHMADRYQTNPVFVDVRAKTDAKSEKSSILQLVSPVVPSQKQDQLINELSSRDGTVIVFVATKRKTDQLARVLSDIGHSVALIHGGRSQAQRNRAIEGFRAGKHRILVATDVASRGIDIPHVAHVINFDLPQCADDYIHRIGRTGRAGAKGNAVCFVARAEVSKWRDIVKLGVGAPALEGMPAGDSKNVKRPQEIGRAHV